MITLLTRAEEAFGREEWGAAEAWAGRALRREPDAARAARIVAASRFMQEERIGALAAWNRVGEPRVGALRVVGLERTDPEALAGHVGVRRGDLLTPGTLRLARRRAATFPPLVRARVRYRPRPGGSAEVVVGALERPLLFGGPLGVLATIARAFPGRELRLTLSSPLGRGEVLRAAWRWRERRPRVGADLAVHGLAGVPGIWRIGGSWERETFGPRTAGMAPAAGPVRQDRYRAAVSLERWERADLRWGLGLGVEEISGHGEHLSGSGALEGRGAGDRLALRVEGAAWRPIGDPDAAGAPGGAPVGSSGGAGSAGEADAFATAELGARWRSKTDPIGPVLHVRAGVSLASGAAPLSVWPGAGTGQARRHLLRAHPLLEDDVIRGPAFGRTLVHGGLEARVWPFDLGPLKLGAAGFVDAARAGGRRITDDGGPLHLDAGAGLRVALGASGAFRADVAHGLRDGRTAISAAWEAAWPDW